MAPKLSNPVRILFEEPIAFFIYGEPGVGKTTLAGQAPKPVVISCPINEATSLARLPNAASIPVLGVSNWNDILLAVKAVKRKQVELGDFESVIFDNLTSAYNMCVEFTVSEQKNDTISEATWTSANRTMIAMLDELLNIRDKHLILVAHNRIERLSETSARVGPDFGPSLSRKIAGRVNAMFYYRMQGTNRELLTSAVPGIDVKSRYDIERKLTNPSWDGIMKLLDAYKEKIKLQNEPTNQGTN